MSKEYVVITGASSGIGYETAKAFARKGKNVIVAARRREKLEQLRQEILAECPEVEVLVKEVDLSNEQATIDFYSSLKEYPIEAFINNAGMGNNGDITDPDLEHNRRMLQVNVNSLALLSTLYVADYKDVAGAQLINVASSAGYVLFPGCTLYAATKFFVSALTEGIDHEMQLGGHKLRAKVLAPDATQTEFEQAAHETDVAVDYDEKFHRYHTATQMAGFLVELYEGDKTLGEMDFETGGVRLCDGKVPFFAPQMMEG